MMVDLLLFSFENKVFPSKAGDDVITMRLRPKIPDVSRSDVGGGHDVIPRGPKLPRRRDIPEVCRSCSDGSRGPYRLVGAVGDGIDFDEGNRKMDLFSLWACTSLMA